MKYNFSLKITQGNANTKMCYTDYKSPCIQIFFAVFVFKVFAQIFYVIDTYWENGTPNMDINTYLSYLTNMHLLYQILDLTYLVIRQLVNITKVGNDSTYE